jgi:TetR/AcrR family transcriptional regulator, mexJK operon transcriptional repressor
MSQPPQPTPLETRSARKRASIVHAAREVFMEQGYAGASMDAIAAAAGVSKPTVYNHFADKQQLFAQMLSDTIDELTQSFYEQVVDQQETVDVRDYLRDLARLILRAVMQPQNLRLRRLVIAEAGRFPELGRMYEERAPGRAITAFTEAFKRLAKGGVLQIEDPALAAAQFNWLVLSIPLNHAMLSGDDRGLRRTQVQQYADDAVRTFLAAYSAK